MRVIKSKFRHVRDVCVPICRVTHRVRDIFATYSHPMYNANIGTRANHAILMYRQFHFKKSQDRRSFHSSFPILLST